MRRVVTQFVALTAVATAVAVSVATLDVAEAPSSAPESTSSPTPDATTEPVLPSATLPATSTPVQSEPPLASIGSDPLPTLAPTRIPARTTEPGSGGSALRGRASWYDDGPGLYGAAGPGLRKGQLVRVCAAARCVRLRLTDVCQCYRHTARQRIIDLSPAAFSRLAPLSRGIIYVTVTKL